MIILPQDSVSPDVSALRRFIFTEALAVGTIQVDGDENRHGFRQRHGDPDPRHAQEFWEDQDEDHHQDEGPQRGDQRRDEAVAQGREVAGEEHVQADEQEYRAEELEAVPGQGEHAAAVHEQANDARPAEKGNGQDQHGADGDGDEAVAGGLPDFGVVSGARVVAHHRSGSHSDSHINRDKEIVNIHDDCHRCDAVFPEIFHDDQVEQESGNSRGHFREHLTAAVGTGF